MQNIGRPRENLQARNALAFLQSRPLIAAARKYVILNLISPTEQELLIQFVRALTSVSYLTSAVRS